MRVLHFFKTYLPDTTGGIEQVIYQLCQGNRELGVESRVLTLSSDASPQRRWVADHEVIRARQDLFIASTGFSWEAFALFSDAARQADIIHFHFPWPVMDLVHFVSRHKRPCVVSYHSDIVRQRTLLALYKPLMQRFLAGVDRIMLDNMSLPQMRRAVQWIRAQKQPVPEIEASGNMKLDRVREVAQTGVDFISVGALTHSPPALDISLQIL